MYWPLCDKTMNAKRRHVSRIEGETGTMHSLSYTTYPSRIQSEEWGIITGTRYVFLYQGFLFIFIR